MARFARVIAVDTPHHITRRGNARQFVLESDADRAVYLQLLRHYCQLHGLALAGYCLMSNHIHLIAVPGRPDSLALALKNAHGRYANYLNARHAASGLVWQGRFYSCPLDACHLWAALRYVERNPVRAGLVSKPEEYRWSSAAVHCGHCGEDGLLDLAVWRQSWTFATWREHLLREMDEIDAEIRQSTHTGRPLGAPDFVSGLERTLKRKLTPKRGGRPPKQDGDTRQTVFSFGSS